MKVCEAAITVEDVTFRYQKRVILDHVSLTIPEGKISLIMGASGSGKSTLSHIASGLLPEEDESLESGEVYVFNQNIRNLTNNRRAEYVTMMFQNPDLQFCMDTLRKEMRFCLENISVPKDEMDSRIERIAEELSVESLLDRKLFTLSGGEKQKAALCCLRVIKSRCIILDEPFANLDSISAMNLISLLKDLRDDFGMTIVAVDHQIDYWKDVFDSIILLGSNGKILSDGITRDTLSSHSSLFIKEGVFFPDYESFKQNRFASSISNDKEIVTLENLVIRRGEESKKDRRRRLKRNKRGIFKLDEADMILINQKSKISFMKGSMTALLGRSGCGKTTLFLSLLKQHSYDGTIEYDGTDIKKIKLKELSNNVGIVFQNPINQFITQNVLEEVKVSIKLWNKTIDSDELDEMALDMLEDYGLRDYKRQSPYLLSQGQMRRLAVLSVLAGGQKVLLLDEPTYGQDRKSTETIMSNLKSKMESDGLTVIFTTHDRKLAASWADSIYELNDKSFINVTEESEGRESFE
ncbi:MAG: energy-coupling factor ABC transporter ATP-binding protein [Sphaerochaetaceae bacterium]|nr:energy-coupling factor ABC transporter ATP-binding protein [Sphaerochaetaceae bacterium]